MENNDLTDCRILIVDDLEENAQIVGDILGFNGAIIETATNGLEGLEAVKTFTPDLILLDLGMPIMDGWEMLEELKQNPETVDIPTIALTAFASKEDQEKVMAAGFSGYMSKPFLSDALIKLIKQVLD